jgi:hypothetical protein
MSVTPADLRRVVERVRLVPDRYRQLTTPYEWAERFYRLPGQALASLLELGFPYRTEAGSTTFDDNDLKSAVLMLGLRSPQRTVLRAMANALTTAAADPVGRRAMTIQGYCPYERHDGACTFTLAPAVWRSPQVVRVEVTGARRFELELKLGAGTPRFLVLSAAQQQLFDEAARLQFHIIPRQLTADLGFLAETGLADCNLAMRFLVSRGAELGVEVRGATGLCLSQPFANRHTWLELRQPDGWSPADPFFLVTLARWGLVDGDAWPPHRSPVGAYLRLPLGVDDLVIDHRRVGGPAEQARPPERLGPAHFQVG